MLENRPLETQLDLNDNLKTGFIVIQELFLVNGLSVLVFTTLKKGDIGFN